MMNPRILIAPVLLAAVLTACEGSDSAPKARTAEPEPKQSTAPKHPATTTTSPLDRYNPAHDPNKCVKLNPDGTVSYVLITPAPGYEPSKMDPAIYGKCG